MIANFKWPEAENDSDRKLLRNVVEHKCHLMGILRDGHGPGYVFSIGLYLNFEHPEFLLFGLDYKVAGVAINDISALIQQGRRFQHGDVLENIFENVSVTLVEVDRKFYGDYLGTALWFYCSVRCDFPVLQIVWPDKQGRFPWDSDFDQRARKVQPVLGAFEAALNQSPRTT